MSSSSAALLLLQRRLIRCFFGGGSYSYLCRRSLSLQTPTATAPHQTLNEKEEEKKRKTPRTSLSPSPATTPWLMLSSPTNPESRYLYQLTNPQQQQQQPPGIKFNCEIRLPNIAGHVCIGSSQGFLVSIDTFMSPEVIVFNPLTGTRLPIPSASLLDYPRNVHPNLRQYCKSWKKPKEYVPIDFNFRILNEGKAIISPSLDIVVLLRTTFPAFARVGSDSWTHFNECRHTDDCIFHDNHLYTIDFLGEIAVYDLEDGNSLSSPEILPITGMLRDDTSPLSRYLVESPDGEDLFLVYRDAVWERAPTRTRYIKVLKLERKKRKRNNKVQYKWSKVTSIGDVALFVGSTASFSLSTRDFPALQPNTVYFTDFFPSDYLLEPERVGDTGFCNLEDASNIHFYQLTNGHHKLNWPPPVWFMPNFNC